jgi:ubiquinone/menaquinone biosynthesis C-methylase UbiE
MTTLAPLDAYRRLAEHYDDSPNPMIALEQRVVESALPPLSGMVVADIAAGTGRWARYCAARGARAVAIDNCVEMLGHSPRPAVLADANRLPLRDCFADLTICAFGLGYAPSCLTELARITRRGGTVIVTDIHPEGLRRGWRRTFRIGGEVVEVASEFYAIGDLSISGLKLADLFEPHFGDQERAIFERCGKGAAFAEAATTPAVFVAIWTRT